MSRVEPSYHTYLRPIIAIIALLLWGGNLSARPRSPHLGKARQAVAIDCDTALTSDLRIVRRPYKLSDNLYWGFRVSGNRPLVKETDYKEYFRKFRPGLEFFGGKYFNPWFSASLNLGYAMQQEELHLPSDTAEYSFHSVALSIEGQLCLNRLFSTYRPDERFRLYAVANAGIQSSFAFDTESFYEGSFIDTKTHFSPLLKAGAEIEWRMTEANLLSLRGLWTVSNSDFCGLKGAHTHRGMELSLGLVHRLINHYASRSFQNCRGNEIYYFDALEKRLLDDHQKQLKLHHKGKAEAPILAAEEDSILIFPYGYPYLTPRQEAKLDKAAIHLAENPNEVLVLDLYPIIKDDPKMTTTQAVQRTEIAIRHHLLKERHDVAESQLRFIQHSDQHSPIPDESIWIHGAFLHFESSTQQR